MTSLQNFFKGPQLLCMAHMINLCVSKSIYFKSKKNILTFEKHVTNAYKEQEESNTELNDDKSDSDTFTEGEELDNDDEDSDEEQTEFIEDEYHTIIEKVRKTISIINRSAHKREHLGGVSLYRDTPIRWNSLYKMCSQFLRYWHKISEIIVKYKIEIDISTQEIQTLEKFVFLLKPINDGTLELSKNTSTIEDAYLTIEFIKEGMSKNLDTFSTLFLHHLKEQL